VSAASPSSGPSGDATAPAPVGFFTDTSICIGCKACEVACKEWNEVPDDGLRFLGTSYDNTGALGANTWRHVAFIEQQVAATERQSAVPDLPGVIDQSSRGLRWLMSSDVCKHCARAACLDVCPTGALFRTEFGTVVVQPDICNGCGYCVVACPFGVIDRRERDGRAWKCTLCYDRLRGGLEPACAQACPTDSIQFGPLDELHDRAERRRARLIDDGVPGARLYGHDDDGVGGGSAFFLLLDDPEVYGLPPDPIVTTADLGRMWGWAGAAASLLAGMTAAAFLGRRR
jgi:formate dehydrogenase iron-sulfur subunit